MVYQAKDRELFSASERTADWIVSCGQQSPFRALRLVQPPGRRGVIGPLNRQRLYATWVLVRIENNRTGGKRTQM